MKNNFETWLPKLVIAPGFVLGFAFIYGFMIWNGILSMTGSRMLPNYDEFVGLEQYVRLWEMDRWIVALKNLGLFSLLYVGGSMILGMALAIFLDQKIRAEGLLRTMFDPRNTLSQQVSDELKSHFGNKVYSTVIPRNVRLAEAPSYGAPAVNFDRACKGSQAYVDLAWEVITRRGGATSLTATQTR